MVKITLRLPDEFHKAVEKMAQKNHRSLNGELIRAIEFYLKEAPEAQGEAKSAKEVKEKKSPK